MCLAVCVTCVRANTRVETSARSEAASVSSRFDAQILANGSQACNGSLRMSSNFSL